MTHQHFSSTFLKCLGIAALAVLLIFAGTAAAEKAFFIDIDDVEGTVEALKTVQVPVKVTGAENLYSIELRFGLGDTEHYTIAFNETSMRDNGFVYYSQNSGKVARINLMVNGDKTLFYLDVTPKTTNPVPLTLTAIVTQEGTEDTGIDVVPYTTRGATLTVTDGNGGGSGEGEGGDGGGTGGDTPSGGDNPSGGNNPSGGDSPSGGSSTVIPTTTPTPTQTQTPTETVPTETETYVVAVSIDGSADFTESPVVFAVTLPDGHPGTVELTTDIDTADLEALSGKEIYHAAEITLDHPLPAGETALIHFMIPLSDLTSRGLTAADVRLYHHDHDGLTALPTVYEVIGDTVYYESVATEFSPFIIVFEKGGAIESIEPVKTPVPTPTKPAKTPLSLVGILAGIGVSVLVLRKR